MPNPPPARPDAGPAHRAANRAQSPRLAEASACGAMGGLGALLAPAVAEPSASGAAKSPGDAAAPPPALPRRQKGQRSLLRPPPL